MPPVRSKSAWAGKLAVASRRRRSRVEGSGPERGRRRLLLAIPGALVLSACLGIAAIWKARNSDRVAADRFDNTRFVTEFSLKDADGRIFTGRDLHAHRAAVFVPLAHDDSPSQTRAGILKGLASKHGPDGVGVYGLVADPAMSADGASRVAAETGCPVLLDPSHEVVEAAGIRSMDDVAVLDPEGLVLYRGRADCVSDALHDAMRGRIPSVAESEAPASGAPLPEPAPLLATDEPITFAKHVAPILGAHCVECHRPGEVAPFSLVAYRDAAKRARFLADVAEARRMPPWKAQPGFGDFLDPHRLSRRELAILDRWADSGAPEGNPADLPPPPSFGDGWELGTPDLVLAMAGPYAVPASGDDFRGFVLPGKVVGDRAIAAIEFRPGNRKVVHHARIFIDETSYSRDLEAAAPDPGFFYGGGADIPRPSLGEWNPGVKPRPPLDGVAKPVRSGADVVLLLHYHGTGKPESDRSSVAVYFAKGPTRRIMAMHPLASARLDIPAGEPRHREVARSTLPHDVHAYSVLPHGHNLLREMKFTATLPDGTVRRLLWVKDWDLNWQGQYHFARPVALPRGTRVEVVAYYDNSSGNPANPNSPPKRMKYGPGTDAEMLGCHLYVVADDEAGDAHYRREWAKGF